MTLIIYFLQKSVKIFFQFGFIFPDELKLLVQYTLSKANEARVAILKKDTDDVDMTSESESQGWVLTFKEYFVNDAGKAFCCIKK